MKLPAASCGYQSGITPQPTRLRSEELRRGSPRHFIGSKPKAKTDHSCNKLQGILAKANNYPFPEELCFIHLSSAIRRVDPGSYGFLSKALGLDRWVADI